MDFYREHFLHTTVDGFTVRPSYMDTHLSHNLRCVIGQLRTSSHQLKIETGRYMRVPPEERICQICRHEPGQRSTTYADVLLTMRLEGASIVYSERALDHWPR